MATDNESRVSNIEGVDVFAAAVKLAVNMGRAQGLTDEHVARLLRAAADVLDSTNEVISAPEIGSRWFNRNPKRKNPFVVEDYRDGTVYGRTYKDGKPILETPVKIRLGTFIRQFRA